MIETRLLIVRHGQTDWNLARRYQGKNDIPLNSTGIAEARRVAGALAGEQIDGIVSSDLQRAYRTAETIAAFHDVPIETDKRLRELGFGAWEGLSWSEIEAQYPHEAVAWQRNELPSAPGGETFEALAARTAAFLESMRGRGGTWVVSAHGGTIRAIVCGFLGMDARRSWQLQIKNVSIADVSLYDENTILNGWNDHHHVSGRGQIRPISLALIQHRDHILVTEGFDPVDKKRFYRPLGGGIEFGESAEDAVRRELFEEIGARLDNVNYLATVENVFTYNGEMGHEHVFLFSAELADQTLYPLTTKLNITDESTVAVWKPLSLFQKDGAPPLYPTGILDHYSERT